MANLSSATVAPRKAHHGRLEPLARALPVHAPGAGQAAQPLGEKDVPQELVAVPQRRAHHLLGGLPVAVALGHEQVVVEVVTMMRDAAIAPAAHA